MVSAVSEDEAGMIAVSLGLRLSPKTTWPCEFGLVTWEFGLCMANTARICIRFPPQEVPGTPGVDRVECVKFQHL